ncbi:hypothetical protein [Streptomyces sp. NPDC058084]|uniref:hypothetical protein n=1 Tax=Streptomyces sp. NPDC058084 TaxID=3346333 RepID=UPI0036EEF141
MARLSRQLPADVTVTAGLSQPWHSGVVKGHVNGVRMLKRRMFGRAGFELRRERGLFYS